MRQKFCHIYIYAYSTHTFTVECTIACNDRINTWSSDKRNRAQMTLSLNPMTSVGIMTELLRVTCDHIEMSRPCVEGIAERVNDVERVGR